MGGIERECTRALLRPWVFDLQENRGRRAGRIPGRDSSAGLLRNAWSGLETENMSNGERGENTEGSDSVEFYMEEFATHAET